MKGFSLVVCATVLVALLTITHGKGVKNYLDYQNDLHGFYPAKTTTGTTPKWFHKTMTNMQVGKKFTQGKLIHDAGGRFHWFNTTVVHPDHLTILDQYPELQSVICRESVVELVINPLLIESRSKLHNLARGDLIFLSQKWGCVNHETAGTTPNDVLRAIRDKAFDDGTQILYNTRPAQAAEALKLAKVDVYSEHNVKERPFHTKKNTSYVFSQRKKHLPKEQLQKVKAITKMHACIKRINKFKKALGNFLVTFDVPDDNTTKYTQEEILQKRNFFKNAWGKIKGVAKSAFEFTKKVVGGIVKVAKKIGEAMGKAVAALGKIAQSIYDKVPFIKTIVDAVKDLKIIEIVKGVWEKIKNTIGMFKDLLKLLTGSVNVDRTIELLKNWKTGEPLVDFWVNSRNFQILEASRLGVGVSIPLRFQLTVKYYSCKLFRISLALKAEAAAVFRLSANHEKRMIYQIEEMSKEWTGLEIPLGIVTIQFRPFIATLLGLFTNVEMQMEPLGYEASAGWEVAVGYEKGRGWFTEFNKNFQLVKHDGSILSAGSHAYAMIGIKPMVGFRILLAVGTDKITPIAAKLGEASLALFGIMDISAYAKQAADGTGKRLCVRLGIMYGINFSAGVGLKISSPIKWNIIGPFTYWKDLWKKKHEWSWCPLKNPNIKLPGKNIDI